MKEVSQEFKDAFLSGRQKQLRLEWRDGLVTTNDNIVEESMYLEQSLVESGEFRLGKVNCSLFKVRIICPSRRKGLTFTAKITADSFSYTLGTFTVDSDLLTDDRKYRDIVAYDRLYKHLTKDCYNFYQLFFKSNIVKNIKGLRDSFFASTGNLPANIIPQRPQILVNDDFGLIYDNELTQLSGRDILEGICELNGVYGTIDNEGYFKYINIEEKPGLYPRNDLYPKPTLYPKRAAAESFYEDGNANNSYIFGKCRFEEDVFRGIGAANILNTGLFLQFTSSSTVSFEICDYVVYGKGGMRYSIKPSFLYNKYLEKFDWQSSISGATAFEVYIPPLYRKTVITALFRMAKNISTINFNNGSFSSKGRPWLELGDWVRVETKNGAFAFPIMKRTMVGISNLMDTYECNLFYESPNHKTNPIAHCNIDDSGNIDIIFEYSSIK